MLLKLFAIFIIVPLVELYLLLQLAEATSLGTTLAIVIVTGILGSMLARREGANAWFRFQSALGSGRVPGKEIQDGLMIVFAAALLLTPGMLTDALGFTLLIPAGREFLRRYVLSRYVRRFHVQVGPGAGTHFESEPFESHPMGGAANRSTAAPDPLHGRSREAKTIDAEAVERRDAS